MEQAKNVARHIQNISLALLKKQSGDGTLEIKTAPEQDIVRSHWMSMISVSGPQLKLTFKVHFKSRVAQKLASTIYRLDPDQISIERALDYMREFCNLTAGSVKQSLKDNKLDVGISLPVVSRGFDEIFSALSLTPESWADTWLITSRGLGPRDGLEIACSTIIEIEDPGQPLQFNEEVGRRNDDDGDIEFF